MFLGVIEKQHPGCNGLISRIPQLRLSQVWSAYFHDGRNMSQNVASLNVLVQDLINLHYYFDRHLQSIF